jgi:hypothetical protein
MKILRVGTLVRNQDGTIGRVTVLDPKHNRLEIRPVRPWVLWVRRVILRKDDAHIGALGPRAMQRTGDDVV